VVAVAGTTEREMAKKHRVLTLVPVHNLFASSVEAIDALLRLVKGDGEAEKARQKKSSRGQGLRPGTRASSGRRGKKNNGQTAG
jgi:hypothetical protein